MNKKKNDRVTDDIQNKLAFQRGLLTLMKGTVPLYSPMIEKALDDIDEIMDKVC